MGTVDYYPIVTSAVAGLNCNEPTARQGVYDHARRVLLAKLHSTRPRPSKQAMELEHSALEQAINKVEAECRAQEPKANPLRPSGARAPTAVRRPIGPLMRALAPFGLAIFVAGIVTTYWLAGGRFNNLSIARPRPSAVQPAAARSAEATRLEGGGVQDSPNSATASSNQLLGCSPMLAATDLVACANADAERIEANRDWQAALPGWLSANNKDSASRRDVGSPTGNAAASTGAANISGPATANTGNKARDLTETAKQSAKTGDLERAVRELTEAIRTDPLYADAYIQRGQTLFKLGDVERAIADLNTGIGIDPNNAPALRARGMTQLYKGDEEAAMADLSKAIQLADADPARLSALDLFYAHRSRAALCEKKRLYEREIYDLTAMIDSYWKDPLLAEALRQNYRDTGAASLIGSIYRLRANVHVRKGSPEQAVADLSFAIQLDQQRALALLLERGRLQEMLGRREQALVDFRRVLEMNPANLEAKGALTRLKGQAS